MSDYFPEPPEEGMYWEVSEEHLRGELFIQDNIILKLRKRSIIEKKFLWHRYTKELIITKRTQKISLSEFKLLTPIGRRRKLKDMAWEALRDMQKAENIKSLLGNYPPKVW